MYYSLKTSADRYGEYREGKLIRAETVAGVLIQDQLPGMQRKLRMDGSIYLGRELSDGIREEGPSTHRVPVRKGPSS